MAGRRAERKHLIQTNFSSFARVFVTKQDAPNPTQPYPTLPNPTQAGPGRPRILSGGPVGKPPLKRQASGRLLPHTGQSLPRARAVRAGESLKARSTTFAGAGGPGRTNLLGGGQRGAQGPEGFPCFSIGFCFDLLEKDNRRPLEAHETRMSRFHRRTGGCQPVRLGLCRENDTLRRIAW